MRAHCLGRYVRLEDQTDLTADDLVRMAAGGSNDDEHRLLELYGMLVAEYDYLPVDMMGMQYGDFAAEFARKHSGQTLHNFALASLERLLAALHPQGFVLINDYGFVESKDSGEFEHHASPMPRRSALTFHCSKRSWRARASGANGPNRPRTMAASFRGGSATSCAGPSSSVFQSGLARRPIWPCSSRGNCADMRAGGAV